MKTEELLRLVEAVQDKADDLPDVVDDLSPGAGETLDALWEAIKELRKAVGGET